MDTALATASLGHGGAPPALHQGAQVGVVLVGIRPTRSVAVRVAGTTVRACTTHKLDRHGLGYGGEQGKGERPLALKDAFWGAQVGRGAAVGARVTGGSGGSSLVAAATVVCLLDGLNLVPLQFQQSLQVLLQLIHGPGPGHALALRVEEHCQLPQAPGVERRRQEIRVAFIELALAAGWGGGGGGGVGALKFSGVNDLGSQI